MLFLLMVYFSLFFHIPFFFRAQVSYSFFLLHEALFLYSTLIVTLNRHRVMNPLPHKVLYFPHHGYRSFTDALNGLLLLSLPR